MIPSWVTMHLKSLFSAMFLSTIIILVTVTGLLSFLCSTTFSLWCIRPLSSTTLFLPFECHQVRKHVTGMAYIVCFPWLSGDFFDGRYPVNFGGLDSVALWVLGETHVEHSLSDRWANKQKEDDWHSFYLEIIYFYAFEEILTLFLPVTTSRVPDPNLLIQLPTQIKSITKYYWIMKNLLACCIID